MDDQNKPQDQNPVGAGDTSGVQTPPADTTNPAVPAEPITPVVETPETPAEKPQPEVGASTVETEEKPKGEEESGTGTPPVTPTA